MKKKPFDREKGKKELESTIIEKIREHYLKENHKAKEKNEMSKKSDIDVLQIDELLKKLGEIRPILVNVGKLSAQSQKLNNAQKTEFQNILGEFHLTLSEFVEKKKNFPIKPNDWVKKVIKDSLMLATDLEKQIMILNSGGFCSTGKNKKSFQLKCNRLKELQFFWFGLLNSDAREGFQEVHSVPVFNENEFRKELRGYLEDHFPHEQEPQVQVIKQEIIKRIETDAKPDYIRLAHELLFGFGRPQDIISALKIYHQEADKEVNKSSDINVHACNSLGKIYLEGKYVPQDLKKALYYFEKSLSKDEIDKDPEALYQLGLMEEKGLLSDGGRSEQDNRELAKQYYLAAAEKNHKDAITDLGFMAHEEGDYNTAYEYYKMAKKLKHPRAFNNLGKLYMENSIPEKVKGDNYRKAIKYFELAAEYGNIKALYNLGVCFEKGIGVEQNLEKAYSLFRDSAKKGDLEGKLFYCSHILRNALGTKSDEDFLEVAQMLNEVINEDPEKEMAYFYLGYLYENGFGVGKDFKVALNYYHKAAEIKDGYGPAINKLGNFFFSGFGVEKIDIPLAIRYYERAADLNDPDALINLGVLYETGNDFLDSNLEQALLNFEKASKELGDPRGYLNIGHIYDEGKYVEKDPEKAIEWYRKAASLGDKLAIDLLAAKGKTHLKLSNFEEKNFLKKSQIGKFCDENLIKSGKNELIQSSIAAVKKGKYQSKSPFINGIVTSGLPKEFVSKTNFNPQEYDFNKREEQQNYNELAYSERNEMDNNYVENQKLIDHPSNYPAKNNKKKVAQLN